MSSLQQRLQDLALRVSTEAKALRTLVNGNAADLSALSTTAKGNMVAALNELKASLDTVAAMAGQGAVIDDVAAVSGTKTWSSSKIDSQITAALNALTTGAPGALNTLDELAAALGDDANFAATITAALANRVRVDVANQGLTIAQKGNARANIDAYGSIELGNPDTDLVAVFNAGLAA